MKTIIIDGKTYQLIPVDTDNITKKADYYRSNYKDYENKKQLYAILSMIIGLVLVNLFESNLVYMVSFVPIIFWIFIGYSLSLIQKNKL